jgi:predicted nucleic acid-binding protein
VGFLIDTSVWIEVERGRLSPEEVTTITGNEPVYVSPITIAEMKFGAEIATVPDIRQRRLAGVAKLMSKAILGIDNGTGEMFGSLVAQLCQSGRGHKFRIQDLWLASQAVQHGLTLLTHNEKDFLDIPGLRLHVLEAR